MHLERYMGWIDPSASLLNHDLYVQYCHDLILRLLNEKVASGIVHHS